VLFFVEMMGLKDDFRDRFDSSHKGPTAFPAKTSAAINR